MFFYLSFLRPLPHSSDITSPVSVTPQTANDLRTVYLEEPIDLFYSWSQSLLDCAGPNVNSSARKLTTWRTSTMYKNLTIPLPSNAKPGQEWRLSLSTASSSSSFVIDLRAIDFGTHPLPVISMPVRILSKGRNVDSQGKQEHFERLYSIPQISGTKQSILLCIREQTSFELDKKIWDSGLGLSSWLTNIMHSSEPAPSLLIQELKTLLATSDVLRIVELGAGTGIVSILLSTLIHQAHSSQRASVIATDLPSAVELIEHNVSTNKAMYPSVDLKPLVLDWDDETVPPQVLSPTDLIVMADVTYNTASFPSLVRTLDRLIRLSQSSRGRMPYVLLAYKERDPEERKLWPMLNEIGIDLTLVDKVKGTGVQEVEVWASRASSAFK